MSMLVELFVAAALLTGSLLVLLSGMGLVRFPDVFCRMHAAGKAGTLGVVLIVTGATVYFAGTSDDISIRGPLAIFFQFLTTPAATHLLARACYLREYPLSARTAVDELKMFLPSKPDQVVSQE